MTGLIENSHFLNDLPDPEEAQCVLSFTLKTKEKNLNLKTLVDQGISAYLVEEVDKRQISDATHVVVGIVYGAEAYCVLAQDLDTTNGEDEEARNEAEENLSKIANKFEDALSKNLSVANFKETLDKKENHLFATSLKCRLYSDLLSQPILQCNLFGIYKYILLEFRGQMNGIPSNKMKSVPIAVQLCPLKYLSGPSRTEIVLNKNFHDVDDSLISSCSKILASLKRVIIRAEEICETIAGETNCYEFIQCIYQHKDQLRDLMKDFIVQARLSPTQYEAESDLKRIINKAENHSPFKPNRK